MNNAQLRVRIQRTITRPKPLKTWHHTPATASWKTNSHKLGATQQGLQEKQISLIVKFKEWCRQLLVLSSVREFCNKMNCRMYSLLRTLRMNAGYLRIATRSYTKDFAIQVKARVQNICLRSSMFSYVGSACLLFVLASRASYPNNGHVSWRCFEGTTLLETPATT
jgi:hypothetical protein